MEKDRLSVQHLANLRNLPRRKLTESEKIIVDELAGLMDAVFEAHGLVRNQLMRDLFCHILVAKKYAVYAELKERISETENIIEWSELTTVEVYRMERLVSRFC